MSQSYTDNAKVFKAFCDENRFQILEILKNGEKCACDLAESLNLGQSTLSYHMKILCESGIVKSHCEGKWTNYCISKEGIEYAKDLLDRLTATNTSDTILS